MASLFAGRQIDTSSNLFRPVVKKAQFLADKPISESPKVRKVRIPTCQSRPPPSLATSMNSSMEIYQALYRKVQQIKKIPKPAIISNPRDVLKSTPEQIEMINSIYTMITTVGVLQCGSPMDNEIILRTIFDLSMIPRLVVPLIFGYADSPVPIALTNTHQILQMHKILTTLLIKLPSNVVSSVISTKQIPIVLDQLLLPDSHLRNSAYDLSSRILATFPLYKKHFLIGVSNRLCEAVETRSNGFACHSLLRLLLFIIRGEKPLLVFEKVILPLYTHPLLSQFLSSLQAMTFYYIEDSPKLIEIFHQYLYSHWPLLSASKVTCFYQTIGFALQFGPPSERSLDSLTGYIIESIEAPSDSCTLAAFDLVRDPEVFDTLTPYFAKQFQRLSNALEAAASRTSPSVTQGSTSFMKLLPIIEQYSAEELSTPRDAIWEMIHQMADQEQVP